MNYKEVPILITGAGNGMGSALAKRFSEHQWTVMVTPNKRDAAKNIYNRALRVDWY
jgi:short-subunit dehydrogenase involved in D-alanine esterification of teichoic acids